MIRLLVIDDDRTLFELLKVIVKQDGNQVSVSIRDYDSGVPEEQLPDIFKAFCRVDPSRSRNSGGVGLELALARDAAIAMGGDITAVNSHPGLRVTLTFPVSNQPVPVSAPTKKCS